MGRLDGKVALISGGAKSQGAAEARAFVAEGAKVVVGDILDELGNALVKEINIYSNNAKYLHLDVTIENDWKSGRQNGRIRIWQTGYSNK